MRVRIASALAALTAAAFAIAGSASCQLIAGSFDKGQGGGPTSSSSSASASGTSSSSTSGGGASSSSSSAASSSSGCMPMTSSGAGGCSYYTFGTDDTCPMCEHCKPDKNQNPACAPDGTVGEDGPCKHDSDCAGRGVCVYRDRNQSKGACRPICKTGADCKAGACLYPTEYLKNSKPDLDRSFLACSDDCNPLGDGSDCAPELQPATCDMLISYLGGQLFGLCNAKRSGLPNAACQDYFDCNPGYICAGSGQATCTKLCDLANANKDCQPLGKTCTDFAKYTSGSFQSPTLGGKSIGICQ